MNLDEPTTHEEFGRLVGIGRKAVEKHLAKGVLREGATAGEWLRAYCERLRAEAASRKGDTALALARAKTREAEARAAMVELQFQRALADLVPVQAIEPDLAAWAGFAWEETQALLARVVGAIESRHGVTIEPDIYKGLLGSARTAIENYPRFGGDIDDQEELKNDQTTPIP